MSPGRELLESLEDRRLLTTYVNLNVTNNTQANGAGAGLPSSGIYVFFTQENANTEWTIDPSTGIATANAPGVAAPSVTVAQIEAAGGAIKIDSSLTVNSARIYLSSSPTAVGFNSSGDITSPNASTANYYYDFVEFAYNVQPGVLNIDTTQVDQLGIPITLQVSPADPNFPAGSGIISTLDRQTLISDFQAMATGPLTPYLDCLYPDPSNKDNYFRLLNPKDVIVGQLNAVSLQGTIATSGSPGNWTATYTINGPGSPPPTNGGLAVGMHVSGPFMPAGAVVNSLPNSPGGNTVVIKSKLRDNPFTASTTPVQLFFFKQPTTKLNTIFDRTLDDFFAYYKANPNTLKVEQNSNGTNVVYTGNVVTLPNIPNINGTTSTYTVLQFTGNNEVYNIYYPFFTTNSGLGKLTPNGTPVPPPPAWWNPTQGLKFFESPSSMVFGADGVFADNTQQNTSAPNRPNSAIQGGIENVMVTALARGYATTWQFLNGTISQQPPVNGVFAKTATVTLTTGKTSTITSTLYMSSYQIANVPMSPQVTAGAPPATTFTVTSPLPIPPTAPDLLTFSQFYPTGGTWSAFANFLHNGAGYDVTIDGRAYALPFDDQGGFSSDLNSTAANGVIPSAQITLGAWSPQTGTVKAVGKDLLVTGTNRRDVIRLIPAANNQVQVRMNGSNVGTYTVGGRVIVNGLDGNDSIAASGLPIPVSLFGGKGNDILIGGRRDDTLSGGRGNNFLIGNLGKNRFVKGPGHDRIDPGPAPRLNLDEVFRLPSGGTKKARKRT